MIMYDELERKAEKVVAACYGLKNITNSNSGPSKHNAYLQEIDRTSSVEALTSG